MKNIKTTTTVCALAALFALGACQRNDADQMSQTAGERVDATVASAENKAEEIKADVNRAADQASDKAKDLSITTAVNAELARDPQLSAVKINVDTVDGRVVLKGTAPDEASRERATSLASSISGVLGVDNQLTVQG